MLGGLWCARTRRPRLHIHTFPSHVLLKTIACTLCQTGMRKSKSLKKRGCLQPREPSEGRGGTLAHGGQVYTVADNYLFPGHA